MKYLCSPQVFSCIAVKYMNKVFRWVANLPTPLFVGVFWAVGFLWNIAFNLFAWYVCSGPTSQGDFEPPQSVYDYVTYIFLAPLIETVLFQALPYYLLNKIAFFRSRIWLIILVSSLAFALSHFYSIGYVFFSFFPGVLFMIGYYLRQGKHPFASIYMVHLLINTIPLAYELIFS